MNHETIHRVFNQFTNEEKFPSVVLDESDPTQQTLLVRYPSIDNKPNDYIVPAIKIEAGAKSALDPHQSIAIKPYLAEEVKSLNLEVDNVVTIDAERTFWDKVIILHGIRKWHDLKGVLRQNGHRFSRHYYDVCQLIHSDIIESAKSNHILALDCTRHAKMFFNSSGLDLQHAYAGSFSLTPTQGMQKILKRDYQAMQGMIFDEIPNFDMIIENIRVLETELNQVL